MGVIFGIINIIVAVWFFASAASVKKQAVMWAVIGGLSFIVFKFFGYSIISLLEGSFDQTNLDGLVDKGYEQSDRSATDFSNETFDDQSTAKGIFYEFFPLMLALLGVSYIRAKFILGMGYIASLKHKTSIILKTNYSEKPEHNSAPTITETITNMWKKVKKD